MLRFDYLPSDFNPMFLFLGERQDLMTLARLLGIVCQVSARDSMSREQTQRL